MTVHDQLLGRRRPVEQRASREKKEAGRSQAVNIGPDVDVVAVDRLFGREVVDRSQEHPAVVELGHPVALVEKEPGQAQVEELDRPRTVEEQVARLDIAVDHPHLEGVLEPVGRLANAVGGSGDRHRPGGSDHAVQVVAVDVFGDQEVETVGRVEVVDRHDVGMSKPGRSSGLSMESSQRRGVFRLRGRQHLQRHQPLHRDVFAEKYRRHLPGTDSFQYLVFAGEAEVPPTILEQLLGLEFRQQTLDHHLPGHRHRIARQFAIRRVLLQECAEGLGFDQGALANAIEKGIDLRGQVHRRLRPSVTWRCSTRAAEIGTNSTSSGDHALDRSRHISRSDRTMIRKRIQPCNTCFLC
jgi:hypothetical protein